MALVWLRGDSLFARALMCPPCVPQSGSMALAYTPEWPEWKRPRCGKDLLLLLIPNLDCDTPTSDSAHSTPRLSLHPVGSSCVHASSRALPDLLAAAASRIHCTRALAPRATTLQGHGSAADGACSGRSCTSGAELEEGARAPTMRSGGGPTSVWYLAGCLRDLLVAEFGPSFFS